MLLHYWLVDEYLGISGFINISKGAHIEKVALFSVFCVKSCHGLMARLAERAAISIFLPLTPPCPYTTKENTFPPYYDYWDNYDHEHDDEVVTAR